MVWLVVLGRSKSELWYERPLSGVEHGGQVKSRGRTRRCGRALRASIPSRAGVLSH
jgi:hypothetical protein